MKRDLSPIQKAIRRAVDRIPAKPVASETAIVKAICEYLTLRGIFHWRQNVGASVLMHKGRQRYVKFGFPGVSDIVGILSRRWYNATLRKSEIIKPPMGQFLAIEVKRLGKKATADQVAFLAAVRANGGIAFVATSVDDVRRELGI